LKISGAKLAKKLERDRPEGNVFLFFFPCTLSDMASGTHIVGGQKIISETIFVFVNQYMRVV
jgi:hypothetical protein